MVLHLLMILVGWGRESIFRHMTIRNPSNAGYHAIARSLLTTIAMLGAFATALAADPVVSNITAVRRPGTTLVDISYDLTADTPAVKIILWISSDDGKTFSVPATTLSGAVGQNVPVGTGRVITWNAGTDWLGNYSTAMRFGVTADDGLPPEFALIPAGSFTMGRTSGDTDPSAPPVTVTLSAFHMARNEVTKALWDEVWTWAALNGYTDLARGEGQATNHPVQTVSLWDVIKWCNARSEKEGLTPCYTVGGAVMRTGTTDPTVNWSADGYRLPTEAEWEKAARGGVHGKRFPWGTDKISHAEANFNNHGSESYKSGTTGYHPTYATGSQPYTASVGSFAANGFGLNDMAGNVWEWCWDWYGAWSYVNGATNPRGAASGTYRVVRGGTWRNNAFLCRVANRHSYDPTEKDNRIGFRIARTSVPSKFFMSPSLILDTRYLTLSATPTANGSVTGHGYYDLSVAATLTAVPNPGYRFTGWTGDASGTTNPLTLMMDAEKTIGATFERDLSDADGDDLTAYDEAVTCGTDPTKSDTDADGLSDGYEVGIGRYSIVAGSYTWDQARTDARSKGGDLASFPSEDRWNRALQSLRANPWDEFTGVWIGARDSGVEGIWTWVSGEAFSFASWGTGRPSATSGDSLDFAEVSGGNGAEIGRWYDCSATTIRDGYLLEIGYATSPTVADADGDGLNDGQEQTAGTHPGLADTDGDGLSDGQEVNLTHTKPLLVDTNGDGTPDAAADQDGDGLNNLAEVSTYGTDPRLADTDGDGLADGFEVGIGRFTLVRSRLTWTQASAAAAVAGGHLATFASDAEYARMKAEIEEGSLDALDGVWVGLSDDATEGTWRWVTGESIGWVIPWGTGRPSGLAGNALDYGEISGGDGVEPWKWYDRSNTSLRDGYLLERGFPTDPLLADTDQDGLSDSQECSLGMIPTLADMDGDGWKDGAELEFGGLASDSTRSPEFATHAISVTGQPQIEIRFPAADGVTYGVETSTDLNYWQPIGLPILGTGRVVNRFYSTENHLKRYFRVVKIGG